MEPLCHCRVWVPATDPCTKLRESSRHQHTLPLEDPFNIILSCTAQCLRRCATNRKIAGSIPAGVIGLFIDIKSFRSHYVPEVDSASNRNDYQEYFLGVKAAGA